MRSELSAQPHLQRFIDLQVQPLRLVDPAFYHLDTCFCPLEGGYLLYYPPAFDAESRAAIESRVPAERRLPLSHEDALGFAGNTVNVGQSVILNHASRQLTNRLKAVGFEVIPTQLSEFIRAGGAAKCLSLRLLEG